MTHKEFNMFLDTEVISRINSVLASKSADYSADGDKLYNFKLSGRIDGITSMEALRGMWLKHRAYIVQGSDELSASCKARPYEWWVEKTIDDINYGILMLAMLHSGETK